MPSFDASTLGPGLIGAGSILMFFCIFSTVLVSLAVSPERLGEMPRWFRSLSVIRRTRAVRIYYTVATTVFLMLSLAVPIIALVRWRQVDPSVQVGAVISWPGIAIWLVVLWRTTGRVSQG